MTPPVFAHGHLRLYLLSLLAERSMHGYELIQALSDRFGGTYVPSAGTIYPRLAKLEDEGLVTKQVDGRKSVYAITDAGRAELADREHELDGIESELSDSVRRLADEVRTSVNSAMKTLKADLAAAARDARDDARATGRSERFDPGHAPGGGPTRTTSSVEQVNSRLRLHEAELAIGTFRQELRTELRRTVAHGAIPAESLALLRRRLDEVRDEVATSLKGGTTTGSTTTDDEPAA